MTHRELPVRERYLGGLWGSVIGDALGVPVEFSTRAERDRDPVQGVRGYGTYHQPPGTWSDDSSLMLCTLISLTDQMNRQLNRPLRSQPGDHRHDPEPDLRAIGRNFVRYLTDSYLTPHGVVFDVGISTARAIDRLRDGCIPEYAGGTTEQDNGNGSLMRILPIGLRYAAEDPERLLHFAQLGSRITHGHRRSQLACGYFCLLLSRLLLGDSAEASYLKTNALVQRLYATPEWQQELPHFARLLSGRIAGEPRSAISSSGYVIHTLEASVYLLLRSHSYSEAVLSAINLGGDTDTTACVVGGLSGVLHGVAAIPPEWRTPIARKEELSVWFASFVDGVLGAE